MGLSRNDLCYKSRMTGDCHVRFCERLGVKVPWATRQKAVGKVNQNLRGKLKTYACFTQAISLTLPIACWRLPTASSIRSSVRHTPAICLRARPYLLRHVFPVCGLCA